jgi:hypothetical protein
VGNAFTSNEGVGDRLGLSVAGAGVRLAAADGVASLTGTLPGRTQARVININPRIQTAFFLIFLLLSTFRDLAASTDLLISYPFSLSDPKVGFPKMPACQQQNKASQPPKTPAQGKLTWGRLSSLGICINFSGRGALSI